MSNQPYQPARLKALYRLEVEVISPSQAGSGAKLLPDIDYYEDGRGVHIINVESLLTDPELAARAFTTGGRFRLADLPRPELQRHIAYTTRGQANRQEIVAHARDGAGRPYLPGSSLKGALRTVLGWQFYDSIGYSADGSVSEKGQQQLLDDLNLSNPELVNLDYRDKTKFKRLTERADDRLEKAFFVGAKNIKTNQIPNYDLMKVVQVADLYPVNDTPSLQLQEVQTFVQGHKKDFHPMYSKDGRRPNQPSVAELLKEGTQLSGRLTVDTFALNQPKLELREKGQQLQLQELANLGYQRAKSLISTELDFYEACMRDPSTDNLFRWYNDLYDRLQGLKEGEFLLPLGWSTGWNGKTYAENLQDSGALADVRHSYRLGHWDDPEAPFPISRKLIVNRNRVASLPLGWLLVRLTPLQEGQNAR